jgi:hypothetical protein
MLINRLIEHQTKSQLAEMMKMKMHAIQFAVIVNLIQMKRGNGVALPSPQNAPHRQAIIPQRAAQPIQEAAAARSPNSTAQNVWQWQSLLSSTKGSGAVVRQQR